MTHRLVYRLAGLAALLLPCGVVPAQAPDAQPARKPNIVVILADDQGYADLGAQHQVKDVQTTHLDRMAAQGVRFSAGYITAPQCSPSRAGLLTGRYQQRFSLEHIPDTPLPLDQVTLADRLKSAGYTTGMVGKWHLDPNPTSRRWAQANLPPASFGPKGNFALPFSTIFPYYAINRGFSDVFQGELNRYWATYDLQSKPLAVEGESEGRWIQDARFRVDVQSDAAVAFIERNHEKPFFLYLAYYAPHTPLQATDEYLARFPGEMPNRRRYALAMIAGIDDGVGRVLDALERYDLDENTLVFYTSDNGAPLKITKEDSPVDTDPGGWDGSLNDPWVGEKGMLSEGGIRVPFVARWKGVLPAGKVYDEPVISLDIAATAVALAGQPKPAELDGVNLIPYLTGEQTGAPHEALFWRFWTQTAVRKGDWKYLQVGNKARFLFNLASPEHERQNQIDAHPEIAAELEKTLTTWTATLPPPTIGPTQINPQEVAWYDHYFGIDLK